MPSAIAIARCIRSRCRLLVREGPSVSGAEDPVPRTLVVQSGGTRSEAALPTLCCVAQAQRRRGDHAPNNVIADMKTRTA